MGNPGSRGDLLEAVKAAMNMKYIISNENGMNPILAKYSTIDYGIGIDHGPILSTKIGLGKDVNTRDLIWIGNPVNKSVKISELHKDPYNIGISSYVYDNLLDYAKFHITKNYYGQEQKIDMWNKSTFYYNNVIEYYYYTSYYWTVD